MLKRWRKTHTSQLSIGFMNIYVQTSLCKKYAFILRGRGRGRGKKPSRRLPLQYMLHIVTASTLSSSLMLTLSCKYIKTTSHKPGQSPTASCSYQEGRSTVDSSPLWNITKWASAYPCKGGCKRTAKQQCQLHQKRRPSSKHSRYQGHRRMAITCCPGSSKSFWWGFIPDITDWTVICNASWSWHPHQPAPVVQDDQTTEHVLQRCPLHKATKAVVWPVSTPLVTKLYGCKQSWRRRLHLSPDRPSSCSLQMLRRRRRRRRRRKGPFSPSPSFSHHPPVKVWKANLH